VALPFKVVFSSQAKQGGIIERLTRRRPTTTRPFGPFVVSLPALIVEDVLIILFVSALISVTIPRMSSNWRQREYDKQMHITYVKILVTLQIHASQTKFPKHDLTISPL